MQIVEIKPDFKLNHIIYSYYLIQNHANTHDNIPPLGHPVIQFHEKSNLNNFFSNYNFPIEDVMIIGQLSKFAKIKNTENTKIIGVNLKPTALHKLLNTSVKQFTDKGTPAAPFFGHDIYQLSVELKNARTEGDKAALLNHYFLQLIANKPLTNNDFDILADTIYENKGKISTEEIKNICPVSDRTRQRYFTERIGLSLKTYLRVIRNLNFFKMLNEQPDKPIPDIIFEVGYYDYSHFIKDFRLMTGVPPQIYFSNKEAFAKMLLRP